MTLDDSRVERLGPLGVWTFHLDTQPMSRAQETAVELGEWAFGAPWVPEAVAREPFANVAVLLAARDDSDRATATARGRE